MTKNFRVLQLRPLPAAAVLSLLFVVTAPACSQAGCSHDVTSLAARSRKAFLAYGTDRGGKRSGRVRRIRAVFHPRVVAPLLGRVVHRGAWRAVGPGPDARMARRWMGLDRINLVRARRQERPLLASRVQPAFPVSSVPHPSPASQHALRLKSEYRNRTDAPFAAPLVWFGVMRAAAHSKLISIMLF